MTRTMTLDGKLAALLAELRTHPRLAVALSGGVDSAVLAYAAHLALDGGAVALTLRSELTAHVELLDAARSAQQISIEHHILTARLLDVPALAANAPDRCYHCKRETLRLLLAWAAEHGCACLAEGTNADELAKGDRPGWAAVLEAGDAVCSPLRQFTKGEIRALARRWRLDVADKPGSACLASRVATGDPLSEMALNRIAAAEDVLRAHLGPRTRVRCRVHEKGTLARIVVDAEHMEVAWQCREILRSALTALGFAHVTLDLSSYGQGK